LKLAPKKKSGRKKRVPQRTCVGCRQVLPKRSLIRIVRCPDEVRVDLSGKMAGRGAYLHDSQVCWDRALKGSLAQALKTSFTDKEIEELRKFMATLTKDSPNSEELESE